MYMLCTHLKEREQKRGKESKTGNMCQYVVENHKHVVDCMEINKERAITLSLTVYIVFT